MQIKQRLAYIQNLVLVSMMSLYTTLSLFTMTMIMINEIFDSVPCFVSKEVEIKILHFHNYC